MKTLKFVFFAVLVSLVCGLRAEKKPTIQPVYIFGFSASFTDSVAFLTDVIKVDSACVLPNGFLADRPLYSLQLEDYVLNQRQVQNSTNAVFFSVKKKDAEKKYNKVNSMYKRGENLSLVYLGQDEFRFKPVEYVESVILTEDEDAAAKEEVSSSKENVSGKKKKGGKK